MNIVLFGPPGSGKATQSSLLVERHDMRHVCVGELLRTAVRLQTELGKQAKGFMNAGQLVPDQLIYSLMDEIFQLLKGKNFILDGFPRSVPQATELDAYLAKYSLVIDKVVLLEVPRRDLMRRLAGRRVCTGCDARYHTETKKPKKAGVCDHCSQPVVQRKDDDESVISYRLKTYDAITNPLKNHFAKQGKLLEIDGLGDNETIYKRFASGLYQRAA